jgi:hypothetical protein
LSRDVIFDETAAWKWDDSINPETTILELPQALKQHDVSNSQNRTGSILQNRGSSSSSIDESDSETSPKRVRSLTDIYNYCHVAFFSGEPQNFKEAVKKEEWRKAMNEEMISIEKNQTWKLVNMPKKKKAVGLKWVFKIKYNEDGSIQKHKARIVAKGYSQQHGVDLQKPLHLLQGWKLSELFLLYPHNFSCMCFSLMLS